MGHRAIIGLGSNLGDRKGQIECAIRELSKFGEVKLISSLYETEAWGYDSSNAYYNACVELITERSPGRLLTDLLDIETAMGRDRPGDGYSDRNIDLDILFYDKVVLDTVDLSIPHPQMAKRNFVLEPLNEIAPNLRHPKLNKTINELLILSLDPTKARRIG